MNTRQLCEHWTGLPPLSLPKRNSIPVPGAGGVIFNNCLVEGCGGRTGKGGEVALVLEKDLWHFVLFYFKDQSNWKQLFFNNSGKVNRNISQGFTMGTPKRKHFMLCFNNLSLLDRGLKRVQSVSTNHQDNFFSQVVYQS